MTWIKGYLKDIFGDVDTYIFLAAAVIIHFIPADHFKVWVSLGFVVMGLKRPNKANFLDIFKAIKNANNK